MEIGAGIEGKGGSPRETLIGGGELTRAASHEKEKADRVAISGKQIIYTYYLVSNLFALYVIIQNLSHIYEIISHKNNFGYKKPSEK